MSNCRSFVFTIFSILYIFILKVECAKILGIFNHPSRSHHVLGETLSKALTIKGHDVTMVSTYKSSEAIKNFKTVVLTQIRDDKAQKGTRLEMQESSWFLKINKMRHHMQQINQVLLDHVDFQELLSSNATTFDLVIQDWLFNPAILGVAHHFKCPVIIFSSSPSTILLNPITENSFPYFYIPNTFLSFPYQMSFMQRLKNTIFTLSFEFLEYLDFPLHERQLKRYFLKAPPLGVLLENVSLTLVNTHFSIENSRPYLPSIIPIGGFHLDNFQDQTGSLDDFVYGEKCILYCNIKSTDLIKIKIDTIVKVFHKVPLRILWKVDDDKIRDLPDNVIASKSFPQNKILAHPNTKVFMTTGESLSIIEAVYHGVPIIGIPFFPDEEYNIAHGVSKGYAIQIPYHDLSEDTLLKAIKNIMNDSSFRENIKMRSMALRDQPLKPMESAIFWIEYVIRHKGAPLLKSAPTTLKWYQYFLLDLIAFLIEAVVLFLMVVWLVVKCIKIIVLKITVRSRKPKLD